LIFGKTTPARTLVVDEMRKEHGIVDYMKKGERVSIKLPFKARRNDKVFLPENEENSWRPVLGSRSSSGDPRRYNYYVSDTVTVPDTVNFVDASGDSMEHEPDSLNRDMYGIVYGFGISYKLLMFTAGLEYCRNMNWDKASQDKIKSFLPRYQYNHRLYESRLSMGIELDFNREAKLWAGLSNINYSYFGEPVVDTGYVYDNNGAYKVENKAMDLTSKINT